MSTLHNRSTLFRFIVTLMLLVVTVLPACRPAPPPTPSPTPAPTPTATPVPVSYYVEQGDAALLAGDFDAAEAAYLQAQELDGSYAPAYSHQACLVALQRERWDESLELAERAVEVGPEDAEAWAYLTLVRVLNAHYTELTEAAERAVELDDDSALAHTALAWAYLTANENEDGQAELERALELDPHNLWALSVQSGHYALQGQLDQSLAAVEEAVAQAPNYPPAQIDLVYAYIGTLEYAEAREVLDGVLERWPDYLPALLADVDLYSAQDQMDEAFLAVQRAERLAPHALAVLDSRGWLYLKGGTYSTALSRFEEAIALDELYYPAYIGRGMALIAQEKCAEAADSFQQALDVFPGSALAHLGLALSYECSEEPERAEEGYRRALDLAPYNPNILSAVANYRMRTGDYAQGFEAFHTALVQMADRADTYLTLGYAHLQAGEDDMTVGNIRQALALEADHPDALLTLGMLYVDGGEYGQAVETFNQMLELEDVDMMPQAYYGLGLVYALREDYEVAAGYLETALSMGVETPEAYLYLGRAYRGLERYRDAAGAFDAFLALDPLVLSPGITASMTQDLAADLYWISERDGLTLVRASMDAVASYMERYVTLSLLSANVEIVDEQRTLKMVVALEDEEIDDDTLFLATSLAVMVGEAFVPRIEPALDGGLLAVFRDAQGQDLIEVRGSLETGQDMLDGLIASPDELLQAISLRDLRRPETSLPLEEALAQIGETVERDRGLAAEEEVDFEFMTPDELRDYVEEGYAEDDSDEERAGQDLLVLIGLLGPRADLEQIMIDLQSSQIAGFYDPDEDVFYVVTEDQDHLSGWDEVTFAHEYLHALQDQHFGLDRLSDDENLNDDQRLALRALIEGEATQLSRKYFEAHLTPLEQVVLMQEGQEAEDETPDGTPDVILNLQTFPYEAGLEFVQSIAPGGYWPAIERAHAEPPVSTEQILHPEKYRSELDEPQEVFLPEVLSQLEEEWRELDNEVMGEFFTREYLAGQVSPDLAAVGAAGWDGDRYAFFEHREDGRDLLIWKTVWDSGEDAREFVLAHRLAFGTGNGYEETLRELGAGDRTLRWEGEDRCIYIRQAGDVTWLVYATGPEDLDMVIPLLED